MGAFLAIDGYGFHGRNSTLWGWPGQNPLFWTDPTGRTGAAAAAWWLASTPFGEALLGATSASAATVLILGTGVAVVIIGGAVLESSAIEHADPVDDEGPEEGGAGETPDGGDECSGDEGRSPEGRKKFKSGKEAQDQLEDIENAQKQNQQSGQPNKIESTGKSEQRLNNSLKQVRSLEDAEDEFGDEEE
jgi:hypothetical protein